MVESPGLMEWRLGLVGDMSRHKHPKLSRSQPDLLRDLFSIQNYLDLFGMCLMHAE